LQEEHALGAPFRQFEPGGTGGCGEAAGAIDAITVRAGHQSRGEEAQPHIACHRVRVRFRITEGGNAHRFGLKNGPKEVLEQAEHEKGVGPEIRKLQSASGGQQGGSLQRWCSVSMLTLDTH